jgi:hypothetical protein
VLDDERGAVRILKSPEADRRRITPGSEIVAVDDEPDVRGHARFYTRTCRYMLDACPATAG